MQKKIRATIIFLLIVIHVIVFYYSNIKRHQIMTVEVFLFFSWLLFIYSPNNKNSSRFIEKTKRTLSKLREPKHVFLFSLSLILVSFALDYYMNKSIKHSYEAFVYHYGLELFIAIITIVWVEKVFKDYGLIPLRGKREYRKIWNDIIKPSRNNIKIIDNQFASYFTEIGTNFKSELIEILTALPTTSHEDDPPFKILLLHPDTLAARQRDLDLHADVQGLYPKLNEGLNKLLETIEDPDIKSHVHKIKVKLFQSTHSISFIAGDEKMNFTIMPPDKDADDDSFGITNRTHLSEYYVANFKKIWEDDRSVELKQYKYVEIFIDNMSFNCYWGGDSSLHDKPRYVYPIENNGTFEDYVSRVNKGNTSRLPRKFKLIHNNKIQWVAVRKIQRNDNGNTTTNYTFSKNKIIENYNKISLVCININNNNDIYEIIYDHHHRINLENSNKVMTALQDKGYCYCSHADFDVYLGRRIKDMLTIVYDFFEKEIKKDIYAKTEVLEQDNNIFYSKKRVIAGYRCEVNKGEIDISELNINTRTYEGNVLNINQYDCNVTLSGEVVPKEYFTAFIQSTIKADIRRINGTTFKPNEEKLNIKSCYVVFHFLQETISKNSNSNCTILNSQYIENTSNFTVIHMVGKKHVGGGINKIIKNNIVAKEYDLNSVLDSLYVTKNNKKNEVIKIEADKIKLLPNSTEGVRNIIGVEFFYEKPDFFIE